MLAICILGCETGPQDGSVKVSGKLTQAGQALQVQSIATGEGWVELRFYPQVPMENISDIYHQTMLAVTGTLMCLAPAIVVCHPENIALLCDNGILIPKPIN